MTNTTATAKRPRLTGRAYEQATGNCSRCSGEGRVHGGHVTCGRCHGSGKPALARITKRLAGQAVTFHGYDGRAYQAQVVEVRRGVATVTYTVQGKDIRTYISDSTRLGVQ